MIRPFRSGSGWAGDGVADMDMDGWMMDGSGNCCGAISVVWCGVPREVVPGKHAAYMRPNSPRGGGAVAMFASLISLGYTVSEHKRTRHSAERYGRWLAAGPLSFYLPQCIYV